MCAADCENILGGHERRRVDGTTTVATSSECMRFTAEIPPSTLAPSLRNLFRYNDEGASAFSGFFAVATTTEIAACDSTAVDARAIRALVLRGKMRKKCFIPKAGRRRHEISEWSHLPNIYIYMYM